MWMETPENELVKLDPTEKEPTLVVDQSVLEEAMSMSNDPEALSQTINDVLASINKKADEYMDLPGWDRGEYDVEDIDAQNWLQDIANKLNKAFDDFQENEKATTISMLDEIKQIDWKVADILFDYREPTLGESARNIAFGGLSKDTVAGSMKHPWTKRVNK